MSKRGVASFASTPGIVGRSKAVLLYFRKCTKRSLAENEESGSSWCVLDLGWNLFRSVRYTVNSQGGTASGELDC